ncbi:MAG TPA: ImcF-related family protein [Terriglobia bacterium]|nr:ImcF-related family protein [Terriglobia bacterium]
MKVSWKTWLAAGILVLWLLLSWFAGTWLHLQGSNLWVLRIALILLGIIGFVAFLWWLHKNEPSGAEPGVEGAGDAREIDVLFRLAEDRLRSSKLVESSKVGRLPLILLVGDPGSGKTSAVLNSGLEPELLAGNVFQDNTTAPTESVNIWLARQTIVVEAGAAVTADPGRWAQLARRLAPAKLASVVGGRGQAPRAVLACLDTQSFRTAGVAEASVRNLQARLREISQLLGISFPVYVLLSRADGLPFFSEFVGNLSEAEAGEILGVTLPLQPAARTGLYAELETKRVGEAFDLIFYDLDARRTDLLRREHEPTKLPGIYEFPREFRKLRAPIVPALVDLCRPSQLVAGPFLRGFYVAGRRTITVNAGVAETSEPVPTSAPEGPVGATRVFDVRKLQAQSAADETTPSGATRFFDASKLKAEGTMGLTAGISAQPRLVQQPLFLPHLFSEVLLRDRAALGASGTSSKVAFWQRLLLASATLALLVFLVGFVVSYVGNRGLVSQVNSAAEDVARNLQTSPPQSGQLPSASSLAALDGLRAPLNQLSEYQRNGHPASLGWWLYTGDRLYPVACRDYSNAFQSLLLNRTQGVLLNRLRQLPSSAPGPNDDYGTPYETLKAYLITTSEGSHSTSDFLPPVLYQAWSEGANPDPAAAAAAQKQFDFYADELRYSAQQDAATCFAAPADPDAVLRARNYLGQFPPELPVYRAMLAAAATAKNNKPIDFNRDFPGSEAYVVVRQGVPAAFTKTGWDFMTGQALPHVEQYLKGEPWVLGKPPGAVPDPGKIREDIRQRYQAEFVGHWRDFLKSSSIVGYKNSADAANKLLKLASNTSPLLELMCTVSQNTSVGVPDVVNVFQPAQYIVPSPCKDQYAGPSNKDYTGGLINLQGCLSQIGTLPEAQQDAQRLQCSQMASTAMSTTRTLAAQNFKVDPQGQVDPIVAKLITDPIAFLGSSLKPPPPPGAGDLCSALKRLSTGISAAAPTASLQELAALFLPGTGLLAQHAPPPPGGPNKANPKYLAFYERASAVMQALYPQPGLKQPQYHYTLTPVVSGGSQNFTLYLDGVTLTSSGGPKQLIWPGAGDGVRLAITGTGTIYFTGPWGTFQFYAHSEQWKPSGSGYDLEITEKAGDQPIILANRQPARISFHLDAGGAPLIFKPSFFSEMGCVTKVAQ